MLVLAAAGLVVLSGCAHRVDDFWQLGGEPNVAATIPPFDNMYIDQLGLRVHNGTGGHILVVGCTVFDELGKQLVRYPSVQLPRHVPSIYDAPFFTTTTPRLAPEATVWISVPNNAAFGILHFHRVCGLYQASMQYAEEVRLRFSGRRPSWTVR